jgi:OmpA-OmpF porin, OOP family
MKNLIAIFIFFIPSYFFAQNIVKNPSFEQIIPKSYIRECEYSQAKDFNAVVVSWSSSNYYTSDILTYGKSNDKNCFPVAPHTGSRMAGIITYHPKFDSGYSYDYHEHIRGEFKYPLEVGKTYTFELWLYSDDTLPALHLTKVLGERAKNIISVYSNNFSVLLRENDLAANVPWQKTLEAENTPYRIKKVVDNKKGIWQKFQFLITADKPYRYFFLGNFSNDSDTRTSLSPERSHRIDSLNSVPPKILGKTKTFWEYKKRIAYYCIDDVSMREGNFMDAETPTFADAKTYTFKNVVFEKGKAHLVETSCTELDLLMDYLKDNPTVKINIAGHTDNTGSETTNVLLSQQRAESVRNYLVKKGCAVARLQTQGLGSAQPIVSNDTEEGRQKNRRVEVTFL